MPAQPQWLLRLPDIQYELEQLSVPVVDRAMVEKLFRLKRRQAIELMHRVGGYQAGRAFLVDRVQLIDRVRALQCGADFEFESRRHERLSVSLEDMRRERRALQVRIPVARETLSRKVKDLPCGIILGPGRLEIQFNGTEDLLRKLVELSRAACNDFDRFESVTAQS